LKRRNLHRKSSSTISKAADFPKPNLFTSNLNQARQFPPGRFFARFRAAITNQGPGEERRSVCFIRFSSQIQFRSSTIRSVGDLCDAVCFSLLSRAHCSPFRRSFTRTLSAAKRCRGGRVGRNFIRMRATRPPLQPSRFTGAAGFCFARNAKHDRFPAL